MNANRVYTWESYPEYIASRQYSRCLGRILTSLPAALQRRAVLPLYRAAVLIARGIAGAHADVPPGEELPLRTRELFREAGLDALAASREMMHHLKQERVGRPAEIGVALELLERIEAGLRDRPLGPST